LRDEFAAFAVENAKGFKVQRETAVLGHVGKEVEVLAEVAEVMHSLGRIADWEGVVGGWGQGGGALR